MRVLIRNSGNITSGEFEIKEGSINLKYGINGLGKSTLARSIYYKITDEDKLNELKPFWSDENPSVVLSSQIFSSCIRFDREYIDQYLFNEDINNNSYEIVINTSEYKNAKQKIFERISDLVQFSKTDLLTKFHNEVLAFESDIDFKDNGDLNYSKKLCKGLKNGEPTARLTMKSSRYEKYLKGASSSEWSSWYEQGSKFIKGNDCPFCSNPLPDKFDEINENVLRSFKSSELKDNLYSKKLLTKIKEYLDTQSRLFIDSLMVKSERPTLVESHKLKELYTILKSERHKLSELSNLSPSSLVKELATRSLSTSLRKLKLNTNYFLTIDKDLYEQSMLLNKKIDDLFESEDELKKQLGKMKGIVSSNINKVKKYVNTFLMVSGIPYELEIVDEGNDRFRSILHSSRTKTEVGSLVRKLSFGEQNAIALVLFSIEVSSGGYDLVILDDPISSYDNLKKYAIMHSLFAEESEYSFYGRTVLLLTHDFAPIIDFVKNGMPSRDNVEACFIANIDGRLFETPITRDSIRNSIRQESECAKDVSRNEFSRIVHLRRYLELNGIDGSYAYDVLSSLLHLRADPKIKVNQSFEDMSAEQLDLALEKIKEFIPDFEYSATLRRLLSDEEVKRVYRDATSLEKIHLARVQMHKPRAANIDEPTWKFLNECFHIENDYVFSLDPHTFDQVPSHILKLCDDIISC